MSFSSAIDKPGARRTAPVDSAAAFTSDGPRFSIVMIVLVVLVVPPDYLTLDLGGVLITPLRLCLILLALPAVSMFMRRHGGRLYAFDWLFLGFVGWTVICEIIKRGGAGIERGGQFFLEMGLVYILVQGALTHVSQVIALVKLLFWIIVILMILAIIESAAGENLWMHMTRSPEGIGRGVLDLERRFGLIRVTTLFKHPIHHGVFSAVALGFVWYLSKTPGERMIKAAIITIAAALSLSSGPLLTLILQYAFIGVEYVSRGVKRRFTLIASATVSFLTLVHFTAGRGIFALVAIIVLSPHTAYYRRTIWMYGQENVLRSPIIGIIPENWNRPFWMTGSIDNFWLLIAMQGGIPAALLLISAIIMIAYRLFRAEDAALPDVLARLRRGWGFTILALCLVGGTVHFYDMLQPYFALILALGAAIVRLTMDWERAPKTTPHTPPPSKRPRAILS